MEAWRLALLAWEGLKLLVGLASAVTPAVSPAESANICYQELARDGGPAFCTRDITGFTLSEPDSRWMVRR